MHNVSAYIFDLCGFISVAYTYLFNLFVFFYCVCMHVMYYYVCMLML